MILINLLPHREVARKRRRDAFFASLGFAALVGGIVSAGIYAWYEAQISSQQGVNRFLQTEIKKLDDQIKDIATLQAEIAALRARQQAVEDLQADRNLPVHLLNEIVRQLPDGVYVTALRQENQGVTLQGVAQSNERVSDLLRNLSTNSPWLVRPELVEIIAGSVSLGARDQRRVSNFTIRVKLQRASEAPKGAASAMTPASTSSPATPTMAAASVKKA